MEDKGAEDLERAKFLGEFRHTLDAKGRVILPADFRDELSEGLVMAPGQDNCLTVYPPDEWANALKGLRNLRSTDVRERQFVRVITSQAHPGALDRQGRITIPARLRNYAGLTKDVMVVGKDAVAELWDAQRWERYLEQGMDEFANTEQSFDVGGNF